VCGATHCAVTSDARELLRTAVRINPGLPARKGFAMPRHQTMATRRRDARIVATSVGGLAVTPSNTMDSATGRQRSMSAVLTNGIGAAPDSAPVFAGARVDGLSPF
jgi:hypothetical protein